MTAFAEGTEEGLRRPLRATQASPHSHRERCDLTGTRQGCYTVV
jgi:hypothetical protein